MHKKAIVGLMGVLALTGAVLGSGIAFADDSVDSGSTTNDTTNTVSSSASANASVTVSAACSFERSGSGEYAGILANNASIEVAGSTFSTICNDSGGYAIYAVGYSNNALGNTDLIFNNDPSSSNNITTNSTSATGTSYWQMKLTAGAKNQPVLENGYGNYSVIPSTYTKVASYASAGTGTAQTVAATYKATASSTQPAGTYTGAVKYTMVHPNDDAMTTDEDIDDIVYLQDFASLSNIEQASVIDSMVEGQVYTRKDSRDNQDYTIAKLKDGKVWMTKNLNLAGGTELSSDTTDFASNYTLPTTNGWTVNNGKLVLPASATKNADNNNLTDSTQFSTKNYAYVFNSSNTTNCGALGQDTPCYSYYSWDAATLGSGRGISTDNTDTQYSICPKGWKLPTSRTTSAADWQTESDFYVLAHQYGLNSTTSASESDSGFYDDAGPGTAPNFLLAGYYGNGSFNNGSDYGLYWSATSGGVNARNLYFTSSYVNSASDSNSGFGYAVRCIVAE